MTTQEVIQIYSDTNKYAYIGEQLLYLKQYLNMSERQKGEDLLYQFPYIIDVISDGRVKVSPELYSRLFEEETLESHEQLQILLETPQYQADADNVCNYLYKNVDRLDLYHEEIPSWYYFQEPEIVKNQFLIHFTNDAMGIASQGFQGLATNLARLGLTTYTRHEKYDRDSDGYGFAYTMNDYAKYAFGRRTELKYGDQAVIFRASGLRLYHNTDNEYQTIFAGSTARNIIPITSGQTARYGVYNKQTRAVLREADDINTVVDWVVNNYNQYKNVLEY